MVMVLEDRLVREIARIGRDRVPCEACGLLLPYRVNGVQVLEMPNRSRMPHDSFEMHGEDMVIALETVFRGEIPDEIIPELTAWHTHPRGNVGPSRADLENRPKHLKSLVVTLVDGADPLATWF